MHNKLFDKLCDILDDMERKEKLSASDLQIVDWATHAKKSMLAVDEMMGEDEYSSAMDGRRSNARGRRRDSMGRYSSESYGRSNRGRSYRDGMSREGMSRDDGKGEYMEQLYEMMENAPDEKSRQNIQRMIREME